jgi:hypothetical protein
VSWAGLPTSSKFGRDFLDGLNSSAFCPAYGTMDMNGDGRPDLVLTSDCDDATAVGRDHWLVYMNTGSGFAATPVRWAGLPTSSKFGRDFLDGLYSSAFCPAYGTTDMNGDGKPDLVLTSDCDDSTTVGRDHWLVYMNMGAGFAATPVSWAGLPTSSKFGRDFLDGLYSTAFCPAYGTMDMNGDGHPDLVLTSDCDDTTSVGTDHWLVYLAECRP